MEATGRSRGSDEARLLASRRRSSVSLEAIAIDLDLHPSVVTTVLAHDMKRSLPILRAQLDEDWYPDLGRITVPTVVLCGERDKTCKPWHSKRLGRDIPDARTVWLPGVGHMVTCEAPDSILSHVRELSRGGRASVTRAQDA